MIFGALRGWRSAPDERRWVVLDVEASGLDPGSDRLLAIAAVALRRDGGRLQVELADSFEVVLRQAPEAAAPDRGNILLHGIGVGAQRRGLDARSALAAFESFAGSSPRLGFHVAFDRRMIERAARAAGVPVCTAPWLDIGELAAVAHPEVPARALDDWLRHFGIVCAVRHQAAADAMATAELLQRLWPRLRAEGADDVAGLRRLAARQRWLPRGHQ